MTKTQLTDIVAKVGVENCLYAADLARKGEGCSTVGFLLGLHWKKASLAMDAGRMLREMTEITR